MKKLFYTFILSLAVSCEPVLAQTPAFGKTIDEIKKANKLFSFDEKETQDGHIYIETENENRSMCFFFENEKSYLVTIEFSDDKFWEQFQAKLFKTASKIDPENWWTSIDKVPVFIHEVADGGKMNLYYTLKQWEN